MRNLGKTISGAFAALRRNVLETRRVIATALEGRLVHDHPAPGCRAASGGGAS